MLNRKRVVGLLAGGLLLLPAAGAGAAGDGVRLGPALLYPTLRVTETHDDNIGRTSGAEADDWVTSVAPAIRVALPVRHFFVEAEGGLDFLRYQDNDSEDATNWFLGAAVGGDFPGGLSFKIGDTHSARWLVGSQEFGPGEDSSVNTLRGTVAYAVREALRLELTGLRTAYAYDDSAPLERVETGFQADAYWKFRPRLSAILEASTAQYAYDSNGAQDGSAFQLGLGANWDVTAKSTGFAKAGYQWKRYDDEDAALGTENAGYFTLSAGLRHFFTPRTMLQGEVSRASRESDFPENPYFLQTALGVSLAQRFAAKLYGRVGLRYAGDAYPNRTTYRNPYEDGAVEQTATRTDSLFSWTAAAGFDVTRWLQLELALGGERRDSNFDTFDYSATRVSLSAKAAF